MLSNKEKFIFTSELALAISNGLQIEEGLKMLAGFDAVSYTHLTLPTT